MEHHIYRVTAFEIIGPHRLKVSFDDGSVHLIDITPVLVGEIYAPLRDLSFFEQVKLDPEVHTLVWPNGADFDPETLHDWNKNLAAIKESVSAWETVPA